MQKRMTADGKALQDVVRERDVLTKMVSAGDERVKNQVSLVGQHEWQSGNLEKEVIRWKVQQLNSTQRKLLL